VRILLIEDDRMIGRSLVHALRDDGYAVDWVRDGAAGEEALRDDHATYSLVLLDWNLPKRSGIDLLRAMRRRGQTVPVFVLSARDALDDLVTGLDSGADDYLIKPFELAELRARIRVLLRRRGEKALQPGTLVRGDIEVDLARHEVKRGGQPVSLTPKEFSLLYALMEGAGTVLSRSQLEQRIYGWDEEVVSNAIEFLIHGLRKKLGAEAVRNVRGVGWRIGGEE
jgi:DNA-binding response OmpR family regulator